MQNGDGYSNEQERQKEERKARRRQEDAQRFWNQREVWDHINLLHEAACIFVLSHKHCEHYMLSGGHDIKSYASTVMCCIHHCSVVDLQAEIAAGNYCSDSGKRINDAVKSVWWGDGLPFDFLGDFQKSLAEILLEGKQISSPIFEMSTYCICNAYMSTLCIYMFCMLNSGCFAQQSLLLVACIVDLPVPHVVTISLCASAHSVLKPLYNH